MCRGNRLAELRFIAGDSLMAAQDATPDGYVQTSATEKECVQLACV